MDLYLKLPNVSKTIKKKIKSHKSFWCEELTMLWGKYRDSEKALNHIKVTWDTEIICTVNKLVVKNSFTKS